jgi:exopolysaccharide production protein ExoQ
MVNESFGLSFNAPRRLEQTILPSLAFFALLLLIFVGLEPFTPPASVAAFGGVAETSRGDTLRQAAYLSVFAIILVCAIQRRGILALRAVPLTMGLLLLWCVASSFWAAEPDVALRRAGLEVIVCLSLLLSVDTIGAERAFRYWRMMMLAILVVNFAAIPMIATAKHLSADSADAALAGNWRGVFGHKNIAGAVCAMTALLFLFSRNGRYNWMGILVAIAALVFLYFTHSRSSLGFLIPSLAAGGAYWLCWRDGLSRSVLTMAVILLLAVLGVFLLLDQDMIARLLDDPDQFNGRAAVWAAELAYIRDHPFLGSGFGGFTDMGGQSPLHQYATGWVRHVSQGNSGYLQIAVTTGLVGFGLALLALVLTPLRLFWSLDLDGDGFRPLLFALFIFLLLHNFMESDFLEGDAPAWAAFLLMLGGLLNISRPQGLRS